MDKYQITIKILTPVLMFLVLMDMAITQLGFDRGFIEGNFIANYLLDSILGVAGLWVAVVFLLFAIMGISYLNYSRTDGWIGKFWAYSLPIGIIIRGWAIWHNYTMLRGMFP